jgi:serine/threonine-protein kinase
VAKQEAADKARRRKRAVIISVIAGVLVVALVIVAILMTRGDKPQPVDSPSAAQTTTVPAVPDSRSVDDAVAALTKLKLKPEKAQETSDSVPEGQVIRFDPASGEEVPQRSTVKYVVSLGKEAVIVPDVSGLSQSAARQKIEAAKLKVATDVQTVDHPTIAKDLVVDTEPAYNTQLSAGDEVILRVSSGRTKVPDCTGKTQAQCSDLLGQAGLNTGDVKSEESDQTAGTVIRTEPGSNQTVDQKAAIAIVIAEAKPTVTLKDFADLTGGEAREWLEGRGLVADIQSEASSTVEKGKVIRTDPGTGTSVPEGSTVTVWVSSTGPAPAPSPSAHPQTPQKR